MTKKEVGSKKGGVGRTSLQTKSPVRAPLKKKSSAVDSKNVGRSKTKSIESRGHKHGPIFVCRFGLALLRLPDDTEALFTSPEATVLGTKVESDLRAALSADSRISELIPSTEPRRGTMDNARTLTIYNHDSKAVSLDPENDGSFLAMRLNNLLTFRLQVPTKNQPKYRGSDDIPTDTYTVAWNGVMAAVQWEQIEGNAVLSGGHVVLEVLDEVARKAGYELVIMACSPGCHHRFIHADIITTDISDIPKHYESLNDAGMAETILAPFQRDKDDIYNLRRTFASLYSTVECYAEAKTAAQRIDDLERLARGRTSELLAINFRRAMSVHLRQGKSLNNRWSMRGDRRRTRELLATLWLCIAMIENLERRWRVMDRRFETVLKEGNLEAFKKSLDVDHDEILSLDLSLSRATLQDAGSRLDARALYIATALGATSILLAALISRF